MKHKHGIQIVLVIADSMVAVACMCKQSFCKKTGIVIEENKKTNHET